VAYLEACLPRCARDAPLVAAHAGCPMQSASTTEPSGSPEGILPGAAALDAVTRGVSSCALEPPSSV
jgi:hypothetical protein